MQLSRPGHSINKYNDMLAVFSLYWISNGITAIVNGKKQRKMKPFNPATVTAVCKTNPDLECFIRALNGFLRIFSSKEGSELIKIEIYSLIKSDNFDLLQGKIYSRLNRDLFNGFLLNLMKERRIQIVSIIERPLWKKMNNDKALETGKTLFGYSSNQQTLTLTVQNGGSEKQSNSIVLSFYSSREVSQEDNLMDQSSIQSVEPFLQYRLFPITSAEVRTLEVVRENTLMDQSRIQSVEPFPQYRLFPVTSAENRTVEVVRENTLMDQSSIQSVEPFPQYRLFPVTSAENRTVEVVQDNTLMDQSTIQSVEPFPQYRLFPVTSAEDRTLKNQSPLWSITSEDETVKNQSSIWPASFVKDNSLAIQSHMGSSNYVEETLYHSQRKINLQFGVPETEESWKLDQFPPSACTDPSQSEFSAKESSPIGGLERGLFTRKEDRQFESEVLPVNTEIPNREKEGCRSPDSGFGDMHQSPPHKLSKEFCGMCHTEFKKSKFFTQRLYGLLSNCKHAFCYPCIYKQSEPISTLLIRSAVCPICHKRSAAVAASAAWVEGAEKYNFFKEYVQEMKPVSRKLDMCSTATLLSCKQIQKNILLERSLPFGMAV